MAVRIRALCALLVSFVALSACGGGTVGTNAAAPPAAGVPPIASTPAASAARHAFLGAFFRPEGSPPFGVFGASSPNVAPSPYPTPGAVLSGPSGYCDRVMANGYSITSGYVVDETKLKNVAALGVRWTRTTPSSFFEDFSHLTGGSYGFAASDSAQCALATKQITPVIALEAGPVLYDAVPGQFSPQQVATYASAADFAAWCSAVATHESAAFPTVTRYTLPGNEVNSNAGLFPGGVSQIAAYSSACYAAIKAASRSSFVYGFELNMDGSLDVPGFLRQLRALGCGVGTCFDGLAVHLSLRYPAPASATPCYPKPGGDYVLQCIADLQAAVGSPVHVLITETVYTVPSMVPDEATKASAVTAAFNAFAADPDIDGASYANIDECALYPTGFFANGCLIDGNGRAMPAFNALAQFAASMGL